MNTPAPLRVWSHRFSVAKGWHYQAERIIGDESRAQEWLSIFQADEPSIKFYLARTAPR